MAVIEVDELQVETDIDVAPITVTPLAANTIQSLLEQRQIPNHVLRVFVSGGGCSGMQYGMAFEAQPSAHDTVVGSGGVRLVVDPTSMMYLGGATIDFVDSLMGGGFRIDNPNVVSSCGCGQSFRTADSAEADSTEAGCASCSY
jgi:iron-sulfur cluster assembly protein